MVPAEIPREYNAAEDLVGRNLKGRTAAIESISSKYTCQPVRPCCWGASPVMTAAIAEAVVEGKTDVMDPTRYWRTMLPGCIWHK